MRDVIYLIDNVDLIGAQLDHRPLQRNGGFGIASGASKTSRRACQWGVLAYMLARTAACLSWRCSESPLDERRPRQGGLFVFGAWVFTSRQDVRDRDGESAGRAPAFGTRPYRQQSTRKASLNRCLPSGRPHAAEPKWGQPLFATALARIHRDQGQSNAWTLLIFPIKRRHSAATGVTARALAI